MLKQLAPTFLQLAALVLACVCLYMLYQMHLHPVVVGIPDALTPNEVKALLGLCGFFLFGSTSSSQSKDVANRQLMSDMTSQLAQSVPMSAIPEPVTPVVNVHTTTAAPTPTLLQAPATGPNAPLPNIPAVDNSGNLTPGE